jgi:hypothetical protein
MLAHTNTEIQLRLRDTCINPHRHRHLHICTRAQPHTYAIVPACPLTYAHMHTRELKHIYIYQQFLHLYRLTRVYASTYFSLHKYTCILLKNEWRNNALHLSFSVGVLLRRCHACLPLHCSSALLAFLRFVVVCNCMKLVLYEQM